jgi:hypothetical protein
VKHGLRAAVVFAAVGVALSLFYLVESLWYALCDVDLSVNCLLPGLYPWDEGIESQPETFQQWAFAALFSVLFYAMLRFVVGLATDTASSRRRRAYQGLRQIALLENWSHAPCRQLSFWKERALGSDLDIAFRRRKSSGYKFRSFLVGLLHLGVAGFFSLPMVLFTVSAD